MMYNCSDTSKKMILIMLGLFILESFLGVFYFKFTFMYIGYLIGLLICTLCSSVKLILLDKAIEKSIKMKKIEAERYINKNYFIRQLITIIVFVIVAINHPNINFYGGAIGLFNLRFAAQFIKIFFKV